MKQTRYSVDRAHAASSSTPKRTSTRFIEGSNGMRFPTALKTSDETSGADDRQTGHRSEASC
jgi:hypothetical protein